MLKQTFTSDNFRRIFDNESRRGVNLEPRFFPEVADVTKLISECRRKVRDLRRRRNTLAPSAYEGELSKLKDEKQQLTIQKEDLLRQELEKISSQMADGNFGLVLRQVTVPRGGKAYTLGNTPTAYFAMKQLQYNIRRVYDVKQSSRFSIVSALKTILADGFPKYVIRADIKDFYESIPHEGLLNKIDAESLLALPSRKIIRQVLNDYRDLSGGRTGIPRGVGVSAYLSELYMRDFDDAIKSHDELVYYARYVDDIVVVFAAKPNSSVDQYRKFLERQVAAVGLKLNTSKTKPFDLRAPGTCCMEYLGYKITFGQGPITIGLSDKRKQKYKDRIKRSFEAYRKQGQVNEKKARRLLVKRIRFMTGNTRLRNSKANIMIGVYYSNSLLSSSDELKSADDCLKTQIALIRSQSLRNRLSKLSFEEGFSQRRYHAFSTGELGQVTELWRHET
ncbi:MAG: antiviral reverse transcriptase Drt3a [Terriglobia bacterium]|jgi:hypothetical protein